MNFDTPDADLSLIRTGGDDSVLAGLWRQILHDLDADATALYDRIDRYAERITKDCPEKISQVRGNLRTDITKSAMTWFTFKKVLRILDVLYFEIEFKLHHLSRISTHTVRVTLEESFFEKDHDKPSELSVAFREIQHALDIDLHKYEELLEHYMRREKLVMDIRNKTNVRGYLKKDFASPKMTWRTFMKTFVFLCVIKADMKISLTYKKGRVTTHNYQILLGDLADYMEEMKRDLGI